MILNELTEIKKLLQVIVSNQERKSITTNLQLDGIEVGQLATKALACQKDQQD